MYSVLIIDMAHYREPDGESTISGFATEEEAIDYARRRVRDSLAELRKPNQSKEELRQLWAIYGEDVWVVGAGYAASDELDTLLEP